MLSMLRRRITADAGDRLVIAPHHPDRLRRPPARPGAVERDRFQQALTWNVFRTLELVTPAFWLRRLHVRLTGDEPPPAAQIVKVSLWPALPLPPIQRIDGARPDVRVDVAIETEHAVWTLIVADGRHHAADDGDRVAPVVDAGAWLAGTRGFYCGVIDTDVSPGSLAGTLTSRYARSRESVVLRSATRGPSTPVLHGCGAVSWGDLAAVLRACQDAHNLPAIERAVARHAVEWLLDVGVEPAVG